VNNVQIKNIEFALGKKKEQYSDLSVENPSWDTKRILNATGIKTRYLSKDEDIISLSLKSAKKILKKFQKKKIDFLIFVSQTANIKLPSISCIIQHRLKLRNNIQAFDINMGCSGFVYSLNIAKSLLSQKNISNGLIICADVYTKYIEKNNSACRPIFSDASSSIIVGKCRTLSIKEFDFGTDGSGAFDLYLKDNSKNIYMNGSKVALFTIKRVPISIMKLLKKNKLKIANIDKFIFHQASKFVLNQIYRILKIDKNKIYENYQKYGNTVSSSIPIALKEAANKKLIKNNDNVILSGFGVGLSWSSVLIKWKKIV
jgi:3-oxoacyl-[acyl-carrier-protein] synthase-3